MIALFPKLTAVLPAGLAGKAGTDPSPGDGPRFADLLGAGGSEPITGSELPPPQTPGVAPTADPAPIEHPIVLRPGLEGGPARVPAPIGDGGGEEPRGQAATESAKVFDADGMLGHNFVAPVTPVVVTQAEMVPCAPTCADEASAAEQVPIPNVDHMAAASDLALSDPLAPASSVRVMPRATFLPNETVAAPTVALPVPTEALADQPVEPTPRVAALTPFRVAQAARSPFAVALHAVEQGMAVAVQVDALGADERARLRDAIAATLSRHGLTGRIAIAGTNRPERAG